MENQQTLTGRIQPLSLRRNFSWTLAGNVVYAACQWAVLSVLAKIGTPEMVGQFALGYAVTAPVILFASMQLRTVQATDVRREYQFGDYLGLRLAALALALLTILGIIALARYNVETSLIIGIIGLAKAFESLSDLIHGLLQQHERMDRIAISRILLGALQLVSLGVTVYLTKSLLWGVIAMTAAAFLVRWGYDIPSARMLLAAREADLNTAIQRGLLRPHWDKQTLWRLVCLALPMGIVAVLDSLNQNIPRYFLEHFRGKAELGYFSALAYLMMTGGVLISALGNSASPRLAQHYVNNFPAYRRLTRRLMVIGLITGLVGVLVALLFGKPVLTLLYRRDYAQHVGAFVWIMVGAGVWYVATFISFSVMAARMFQVQAPLLLATVATTTLSSWYLVPRYGLEGAAWAVCAGMVTRLLGSGILLYLAERGQGKPDEDVATAAEWE